MVDVRLMCLSKKGTWPGSRNPFETQIIPVDPFMITRITSCDDTEKRALFTWWSAKGSPMRDIFSDYPTGGESL